MAKKTSLKDLSPEDLEAQKRELDLAQRESLQQGSEVVVEEDPEMQAIDAILHSNDLEGGTIRISRRGPTEQNFSYLCKMKTGEFDIDFIKNVYGGGYYQCKTHRSNGQMYKGFEFAIDPRFRGSMDVSKNGGEDRAADPIAMLRAASDITAQGNRGQDASTQAMMKMQSESMQMFLGMMQANALQQQQSADRSLQMVTTMMTAVTTNKHAPSEGITVKDLLVLIPTLVPLLKGEKAVTPTLLETIEAMTKMRELVSSGTVAEMPEPPKTVVQQFMEALPHAASIVSSLRGQPPAPAITPPSAQARLPGHAAGPNGKQPIAGAPPATPAAVLPGQPVEAAASTDDRKVQLLATLVSAARRNREVELYHDLVVDELEDSEVPMFKEVLTNSQTFASLFSNIPDFPSLAPWFEELRVMLLTTLNSTSEFSLNGGPAEQSSTKPSGPASSSEDSAGVQPGRDAGGTETNP